MTRYGSLVDHLIDLRREGRSFDAAWQIAAGRVPAAGEDGGAARFRYDAMKLAYHGGGKPCRLDRDSASDPEYRGNGVGHRGKSRPGQMVA